MSSQHLIQSIGWTLIHSLWQGLAIFIVLKIGIRVTPRSDLRYAMGVGAMGLMLISSVVTFCILNTQTTTQGFRIVLDATQASPIAQSSLTVLEWVNQNIIWFIRFWMLGFVVGLVRIAAGLWYIGRLRRNSYPVQDEWMDLVKRLSDSLNVNQVVAMAEASISSPMVVGFIKPIILFPVGLLSGLSTEQVETILVHELSHIRRQDYIINLVQSVIETIFFFNPFTLLISSMIREERENCCDDMVIAKGISPISYVRTLAQLEGIRSSSTLALGFAGNKNQLLNRIKRIMENSAKNDWGKGRLVPVALLFLGLVCASWLSISSEKELEVKHDFIAQDTSREDGLVVIKKGRKHSNGWVVEEPVPVIEAIPDKEAIPEIAGMPDFEYDESFMPEMPPMPFEFDEFYGLDSIREFEFFGPDSIPAYHFRLREPVDWQLFEKEFTEKFKSQYREFYEKNKDEIRKMIDDSKHDETRRREAAKEVDLAAMGRMAEFERAASADMVQALKQVDMMTNQLRADEAMRTLEMSRDQMDIAKHQMEMSKDQLREQSLILENMARNTDDYKKELTELMAQDGYIKKGEDLDGLHISDLNGKMTINGHEIKEKDALKYRALRDSYFHQYVPKPRYGRNE